MSQPDLACPAPDAPSPTSLPDGPDGPDGAASPSATLLATEQGTLMETLRMEVVERSAGRTVVRMPVDGARQVIGILHGGATAAVIETAASVAAREAAPQGCVAVGAELQVSHLRPATQGYVTAVAEPVHVGRRTAVYEASVRDDAGRLVARGSLRSLFTPVPAGADRLIRG